MFYIVIIFNALKLHGWREEEGFKPVNYWFWSIFNK